jgi:hypothetical protein
VVDEPQRTGLHQTLTTETARSASTRPSGHKDETFPDASSGKGTCQDAGLPSVDGPAAFATGIASFPRLIAREDVAPRRLPRGGGPLRCSCEVTARSAGLAS